MLNGIKSLQKQNNCFDGSSVMVSVSSVVIVSAQLCSVRVTMHTLHYTAKHMIHLICSNGTAECACLHLTKMSRCLQLTKQADIFLRAYKRTNQRTDLPRYLNICRIQSLVMPPARMHFNLHAT